LDYIWDAFFGGCFGGFMWVYPIKPTGFFLFMCPGISTLYSHTRGQSQISQTSLPIGSEKALFRRVSVTNEIPLISKMSTVQVWIVSKLLWWEQEMQR